MNELEYVKKYMFLYQKQLGVAIQECRAHEARTHRLWHYYKPFYRSRMNHVSLSYRLVLNRNHRIVSKIGKCFYFKKARRNQLSREEAIGFTYYNKYFSS